MIKKTNKEDSQKVIGENIYALATELFPIARSITGQGVRDTLNIIKRELPNLQLHEIQSGTSVFDWTVPLEWNIYDAYILDPEGKKFIDFKQNNLHIVSYSIPVDMKMPLEELQNYLYSLPEQPDAIPYITSYYNKTWGFCLTENQRNTLKQGIYTIKIDSTLEGGVLNYGELIIQGKSRQEVFLSTYICHPSMANNELSGPTVLTYLAKWIQRLKLLNFTYRIIFIPETIGSIVYLSRNLDYLKKNVIAGYNITCIGDDRNYSYLPTRYGDTLSDRIAKHVLKNLVPNYVSFTFLDRGSDERQYCSPGIDLPIASIMRTKYYEYPEYHTSKDDLTLISPSGLFGGYNVLQKCIVCIESNEILETTVLCEPQLGKRGLYPSISTKNQTEVMANMMNLIAYADGKTDLVSIANTINIPMWELFEIISQLKEQSLLTTI